MHPGSGQLGKAAEQVIFRKGNLNDEMELLRRSEGARDAYNEDTKVLHEHFVSGRAPLSADALMERQDRSGEAGADRAVYEEPSVEEYELMGGGAVSADHMARLARTKHIEDTQGYR
jgi:hypothetical protein